MLNIILIQTSHPGNIGSAARAMKNMGFSSLSLVQPVCPYPSAQITASSSNASDVLDQACVYPDLKTAVKTCNLVLAATARSRSTQHCVLDLRDLPAFLERKKASKVGVVFGNETSGLSNADLMHCQYLIRIPTNPNYSSLNLAQAVQIICYEVARKKLKVTPLNPILPAPRSEMEDFYKHALRVLERVNFYNPSVPMRTPFKLRDIFDRTQLTKNEVRMLRGILTGIEKEIQ